MSDDRVILTTEQALSMLPDKPFIHTFRQSTSGVLIGADWDRDRIAAEIGHRIVELSGATATGIGHGMCLFDGSYLFIETKGS